MKVLIADTTEIARVGIKTILEKSRAGIAIHALSSFSELEEALAEGLPDVLIIDPFQKESFEDLDLKKILGRWPELCVLVLSDSDSKTDVAQALQHKVNGYILKTCDKGEILKALQAVAKGRRFFCENILHIIVENESAPAQEAEQVKISQRELDIINLLAQGCTTKDIADKLFLSVHTVNTHRKRISQKLGAKSASEVVLMAHKLGLLD